MTNKCSYEGLCKSTFTTYDTEQHWSQNTRVTYLLGKITHLWIVCYNIHFISTTTWPSSTAFYGVLFPGMSEAAFSNYRLWESLGFIIAFLCSTFLCISSKIALLLVLIALGIGGYLCIEVIERMGGLRKDSNGKVVPIDELLMTEKVPF